MTSIAPTLQGFFTERLISQRHVSSRTIASYRDSLKLLLAFAQQQTGKKPHALDWAAGTFLLSQHLPHRDSRQLAESAGRLGWASWEDCHAVVPGACPWLCSRPRNRVTIRPTSIPSIPQSLRGYLE
jgi:hypothetical protein